jgi:predicted 3-demethylubiquinone-9 3-methyltransferase (glyoxalase superfamily)
MQGITPFLWFDSNAEEAVKYYTSIFKNSKIGKIARYGDAGPGPKGSVVTVEFELNGQKFIALNGGPEFKFNESISFMVECESQQEIDYYWEKLTEGGQEVQCGWLKDKFGLSWQVTPTALLKMIADPDPAKANRAMAAMLKMIKIDLATVQRAYDGK